MKKSPAIINKRYDDQERLSQLESDVKGLKRLINKILEKKDE